MHGARLIKLIVTDLFQIVRSKENHKKDWKIVRV